MPLGGAVILGGVALGKAAVGFFQNKKANKLAAQNPRPTYTIPQEFLDNAAMAKQMAQQGLPSQQYNNALNGLSRNLAVGVGAYNRGLPTSSLASIVRGSNDGQLALDAQDAAARLNNQRFAVQQNGIVGQQKLAQQQYNQFDQYNENAAAVRGLKGAATQNLNGALNTVAGAGLQYLGNGLGGGSSQAEQPRYAGGNFFQRHFQGGLTTPNADLPAAASINPSSINTNYPLSYGLNNGIKYNYGSQWFNPVY